MTDTPRDPSESRHREYIHRLNQPSNPAVPQGNPYNPYQDGTAEWLLYEIFGEQPTFREE